MKKTKIVATISDLRAEVEFIRQLYDAGANVIRLNTAHQSVESSKKILQNIRAVSNTIPVMIDTKGPELRTCKVIEEFMLKEGSQISLLGDTDGVSSPDCIAVRYNNLVNDIPVGSSVLLDDGSIELKVIDKRDNRLICVALNSGIVKSRKSVNVPGVTLSLPALNPKDLSYIQFAIEHDIDFIAHSFVRGKEDLLEIQKILDAHQSQVKLIAKIENPEGVANIDEILDHCYGVMIARGDLAVEIPYENIPIIQRTLINKCIERRKPVIVATQMLHSMINNPRPTRAEVSDIATAIYNEADAVMLSNETATGYYPVEAVKTMVKVIEAVEKDLKPFNDVEPTALTSAISAYLTKYAVKAAANLDAKAIITDTASGRTARNLASYRGMKPVYARCYNHRVVRELALSYGIIPEYMDSRDTTAEFITETLSDMIAKKAVSLPDLVVVVAGNFGTHHGASFIEISTVENLLRTNSNKVLANEIY